MKVSELQGREKRKQAQREVLGFAGHPRSVRKRAFQAPSRGPGECSIKKQQSSKLAQGRTSSSSRLFKSSQEAVTGHLCRAYVHPKHR